MKKAILIFFLSLFYTSIFAYNIPTQALHNKTLEVQYYKLEKNLNKYFENKINYLNTDDKNNFENKIEIIKNLFKNIDDEILAGNKKEAGYEITKLKKEIIYLVYWLKKTEIENKEIITPNTVSNNSGQTSLNDFSNGTFDSFATYYADYFEGQKTSNGNIFSQNYFSAAMCNIGLNSLVQVTKDGKSVIVKVNDRPNCNLYPNLLDMSTISFDYLAKRYIGKQAIKITKLQESPKDYYKSYIPANFFSDVGINIKEKTPNTYLPNESMHINGYSELENRNISLQITSPSGKEIILSKDVEKYFSFSYPLEETGTYKINFIGNSNSYNIYVLDPNIYNGKIFEKTSFDKINSLEIIKDTLGENINLYRIIQKNTNYNIVKISQDGKDYFVSGIGDIIIPENIEKSLDLSREIKIELKTTKTITGFSHDFFTEPTVIFDGNMKIENK